MAFALCGVFLYLFVTCECQSLLGGLGQSLLDGIGSVRNMDRPAHNTSEYDRPLPQPDMVRQFGYDIESFDVVTEDSYILTLFHMTKAKKCNRTLRQPPLIMTHGLLQDSDVWFDAGPDAGLGYILADDCHDVWLGNVRGNHYGRRHQTLDPNTSSEFWDFTYDDMGYYDIPAILDFVLNATSSDVVNYLGFSQGCGTYYIMCDRRPEYCEKSQLKISLAPYTRQLNTKAIGFRGATILTSIARPALELIGIHELFSIGGLVQTTLAEVCQFNITYGLCQAVLGIFDGVNPNSIDQPSLRQLFYHFPAGTSVKNLAHYGQAQFKSTFNYFDYGPVENVVRYGSPLTPSYDLSATTIPVVIIYGNNDGIVDRADAEWLAGQLPNLLEAFKVEDDLWTHFDQTDAYYVPELTLPKIRHYLEQYSN